MTINQIMGAIKAQSDTPKKLAQLHQSLKQTAITDPAPALLQGLCHHLQARPHTLGVIYVL